MNNRIPAYYAVSDRFVKEAAPAAGGASLGICSAELGLAPFQLLLQSLDDGAVHLADAAF
ncbi:hypothetical protein JCM17478_05250 [Thermopirellula anaerolimosa]